MHFTPRPLAVKKLTTASDSTIKVFQAIALDFPDLQLSSERVAIAGLLYIPLSAGGGDFIAFLRKGTPCQVHCADQPIKSSEVRPSLDSSGSFAPFSETVIRKCRAWTDEHVETGGVLALIYGMVTFTVRCLSSTRLS